ncbi:MAG TPA: hypothetical protein PLI52_02905 [Prochlorococcaceae cyanobacterium AMR_MDS_5431]|nr:hypothetical protein [Prochlorococcaceae cyanobacterium AMR_MDS_5431]
MPVMQRHPHSGRSHKGKAQQALQTLGDFFTHDPTVPTLQTKYFVGTFVKVSYTEADYFLFLYDSLHKCYNLVISINRITQTIKLHSGGRYDRQGNVTNETKEFINSYMHELSLRFDVPRVRCFRERLTETEFQSWLDIDDQLMAFDRNNKEAIFNYSS